ncbi:MAG TPA: GEVED domain-containing protein [Flavobacteriales bacterium]
MKNLYTTLALASLGLMGAEAEAQSSKPKDPAAKAEVRMETFAGFRSTVPVSALSGVELRGGGAPANDDCTGADNQELSVGSTITCSGDNTGATQDDENVPFVIVWHSFTTSECADITVNYCVEGSVFTGFLVNLAVDCPDWISAPLEGASTDCEVFFEALPAGTYWVPVMVDAEATPVGPYTIEVSAAACATPPANDECEGAIALTVGTECTITEATSAGATGSMDPIECNGFTSPNANDVWFSFTATSADQIITVEGVDLFDAVLELFSGSCGSLTAMQCEDSTFPLGSPVNEEMTANGLTVGTTYYVRVYDYAHLAMGHNFGICVTNYVMPEGYCIPNPETGPAEGDYVGGVMLGDINNMTGGDNNYEDYTSMGTTLDQGVEYTIEITNGTYAPNQEAAWIDYNADEMFQENEKLGEVETTEEGGGETVSITFTVPMDATLGDTRLRVRGVYLDGGGVDPCEDYIYGETEDYTVTIQAFSGVNDINGAGAFTIFPNPTNGDITINGGTITGNVMFEMTDMTGRVVYNHNVLMGNGQLVTLPIADKVAAGMYTLSLINNGARSVRSVVVR